MTRIERKKRDRMKKKFDGKGRADIGHENPVQPNNRIEMFKLFALGFPPNLVYSIPFAAPERVAGQPGPFAKRVKGQKSLLIKA